MEHKTEKEIRIIETEKEVVNFFEKNFPDGVEFILPQFERIDKRKYSYVPKKKEHFMEIVEKGSDRLLRGLGFGLWETMNNVIQENIECAEEFKVDFIKAILMVFYNKGYSVLFTLHVGVMDIIYHQDIIMSKLEELRK